LRDKVFFSYSRADKDVAQKLLRELSANGIEFWLDQREIRGRWDDEIEQAIQACSALLVVLTPNSARSKNVRDEISYALHLDKDVVPVMLTKCDVPFRIHRIQYVDFTGDYAAALERCCELLRSDGTNRDAEKPQARKRRRAPVSRPSRSSPAKPKPARGHTATFKDFDRAPDMIEIAPGEFMMGASAQERGAGNDERPQHGVSIRRAFAVGRFPVTFSEWGAALADHGVEHAASDHGWGAGNRPVVDVNWDDAQSYVRWLSQKTAQPYRLLTEAEWEYVARAGTTTPFWWGNKITSVEANFDARYPYEGAEPGEARGRTEPVDRFTPNPWGLYQVHGNIWEWCQDHWFDNHQGAPQDGAPRKLSEEPRRGGFFSLPKTPARVVRGGSWKSVASDLRASRRESFPQSYRANSIGFRVARDL